METERIYLRKLAGEVLGVPIDEVPTQLVYACQHVDLARAITLRNAVYVVERFLRGEPVRTTDLPWHAQYNGRLALMVEELKRTGYLGQMVN